MHEIVKNNIEILIEDVDKVCRGLRRDLKVSLSTNMSFTARKLQTMLFGLDRAVRENRRLAKLLRNYL